MAVAWLLPVLCVERVGTPRIYIKMEDGDLDVLREGTCDYLASAIT